jgi:hypothetical protein
LYEVLHKARPFVAWDKNRDFTDVRSAARSELIGKFELATRDKLKEFFHLKDDGLTIRVYLSRHHVSTTWPSFGENAHIHEPARTRLIEHENKEGALHGARKQFDPFTVVSALEAIEAIRLKDVIERSALEDLISRPDLVTDQLREQLVKKRIDVQLGVCPDPAKLRDSDMLQPGIKIFIGGPRANLGTYYYLYGENAGILRPRRSEKNVIESISDRSNQWFCKHDDPYCAQCNLALIQWWRIDDNHWIFYLSGTGVRGTVAAVAYLRRYWLEKLYEQRGKRGCAKILRVMYGNRDNIGQYLDRDWSAYDWHESEAILYDS